MLYLSHEEENKRKKKPQKSLIKGVITMKKNTIVINFETNEARVTKAFEKAANTFGTPEYRAWKACLSENPGIRMVTKTIKKKADKRTYKNMTYENMELYIRETRRELLDEFQRQKRISSIQSSPYRAVLAWFLDQFEDYDSYKNFFSKDEAKESADPAGGEQPEGNVTPLSPAVNL